MTIAIDARWMIGRYRGMGRFAHSLIDPIRNKTLHLVPKGYAVNYDNLDGVVSRGAALFPYWEQHVLPRLCKQLGVETLICPYNTGPIRLPRHTRLILVVHDLIYLQSWLKLPPSASLYQTLGRTYRRLVVPHVIRRADTIVTVSEYSRSEIRDRFNLPESRIKLIPNSVSDDWFTQQPMDIDARAPSILTVTGNSSSKNLNTFFRAFSLFTLRLPRGENIPMLRVVGIKDHQRNHVFRLADRHRIRGSIRIEPFLEPAQLRELYRNSSLFVLPSLFEGFGIPIAEAMASGTPVACSNSTSMPEILQGAGWLFDPRSPTSIAEVLLHAWSNREERQRRAAYGLCRAQRYRQSAVSREIIQFWESL